MARSVRPVVGHRGRGGPHRGRGRCRETEDETPIPLAAISAATIKRHVALLLKALIQRASDSELSPNKSIAGTNAIHSSEKVDTAAAGSLVGLVHAIFLDSRCHLSPRQIWDIVRAAIPKTEAEHWKIGAKCFLINVSVEKRQFAVKDILTELVEKEGMAAALTDFGTSDDERLACTRRVCKILDGFHTISKSHMTLPHDFKRVLPHDFEDFEIDFFEIVK